jgi:hypothetical protein
MLMATIRYGANSTIEIEPADGCEPREFGRPRAESLGAVTPEVVAALETPLDYPALRRGFTTGDRVTIALGCSVPAGAEVVATVVRTAVSAGVDPAYIAILRSEADVEAGLPDPRSELEAPLAEQVELLIHDPADENQLAYLAATDSGHRVMINRALHEADVVIPVGCLYPDDAAGYYGIHTGVFPTYSDAATLERYRAFGSLTRGGEYRQGLIAEVNEVAWLAGINFTVQVLPGDGFSAARVVAGQSEAVRRQARELYEETWNGSRVGPPPALVIAAIAGAARQTWSDFGRALDSAGRLVAEGGAIAVCCELSAPLGPAMQRLIGAPSRNDALQEIRARRPVDALPAAQLARALDEVTVYLLSGLDPTLVEDLDMVPIEDADQLRRLAGRHGNYSILNNATCAVVPLDY